MNFNKIKWFNDRMIIDDLIFRLELEKSDIWSGEDHFLFYKNKELVDKYEEFFGRNSNYKPERILELGTWDGGSAAFWFEILQPQKLITIDLMNREDSSYYKDYISKKGLSGRMKTYWNTDQSDSIALNQIVSSEFPEPPDLIFDDASHRYLPTKNSFEILFPLLKPGGLYIIEDWAWGHWKSFITEEHPWYTYESPSNLILLLVQMAGTAYKFISNLTVCRGFVVVERGPFGVKSPGDFTIDKHVYRRNHVL